MLQGSQAAAAQGTTKKQNKKKDAFSSDGYEHNSMGYTVFTYHTRKTSLLGALLVGAPLAMVAGGIVFAYLRYRRMRPPPGGYSAVNRGGVAMSQL